MLEALKQLIGLSPRDNREVWHEKPLVIVDVDDAVVFSGLATIEYTPSREEYERGVSRVFDESTGNLLMSAEIVRQRVYSSIDQSNPYRLRWGRLGITAKAVNDQGQHFTLFIGRHAHTYLLRRKGSPLDYTSDTTTMPFPEEEDEESNSPLSE